MQGLSMNITRAEAAALHRALFGTYPEDSAVEKSTARVLKKFHVKLDVFLAVAFYGENPTVQQLALWDAELSSSSDVGEV